MTHAAYNTKNVLTLVLVFVVLFWLLYSLGNFIHKPLKINREIEAIEMQNERARKEIEEKKRLLEYLRTPQRIDKEAKIQMGRKQKNEQVLILVEEQNALLPPVATQVKKGPQIIIDKLPNHQKWAYLLFER